MLVAPLSQTCRGSERKPERHLPDRDGHGPFLQVETTPCGRGRTCPHPHLRNLRSLLEKSSARIRNGGESCQSDLYQPSEWGCPVSGDASRAGTALTTKGGRLPLGTDPLHARAFAEAETLRAPDPYSFGPLSLTGRTGCRCTSARASSPWR